MFFIGLSVSYILIYTVFALLWGLSVVPILMQMIETEPSLAAILSILLALGVSKAFTKIFTAITKRHEKQKLLKPLAFVAIVYGHLIEALGLGSAGMIPSFIFFDMFFTYRKWKKDSAVEKENADQVALDSILDLTHDTSLAESEKKEPQMADTGVVFEVVEPTQELTPSAEYTPPVSGEKHTRIKVHVKKPSDLIVVEKSQTGSETAPAKPVPDELTSSVVDPKSKKRRNSVLYILCCCMTLTILILSLFSMKLQTENKKLKLEIEDLNIRLEDVESLKTKITVYENLLSTAQEDLKEWQTIDTSMQLIDKARSTNNDELIRLAEYAKYAQESASAVIVGERGVFHHLECYGALDEAENYFYMDTLLLEQIGYRQCDCVWHIWGYKRP